MRHEVDCSAKPACLRPKPGQKTDAFVKELSELFRKMLQNEPGGCFDLICRFGKHEFPVVVMHGRKDNSLLLVSEGINGMVQYLVPDSSQASFFPRRRRPGATRAREINFSAEESNSIGSISEVRF